MKTPLVVVLFAAAAALADTTNISVELGGKWMTVADIEQLVRDQAATNKIHFDFEGTVRDVQFHTREGPVAVSLSFRHPDSSSYLYAQVDRQGKAWCRQVFICGTIAYEAVGGETRASFRPLSIHGRGNGSSGTAPPAPFRRHIGFLSSERAVHGLHSSSSIGPA
jgi:hypothetical protein